jgi:hypothetical protein
MIDVFRFKNPFKIKAWAIWILILHPTSSFQSFLDVCVSACANKNFYVIIYFELFLPSSQISDIRENHIFRFISFEEVVKLRVLCGRLFFLLLLDLFFFLSGSLIIATRLMFGLLFLELLQAWLISNLFEYLLYLFSRSSFDCLLLFSLFFSGSLFFLSLCCYFLHVLFLPLLYFFGSISSGFHLFFEILLSFLVNRLYILLFQMSFRGASSFLSF